VRQLTEEKTEKESEFETFASQALRLHRKGAYENLLAQHLIMSVASDPFTKVRLICEACYMVNPEKTGLDMDQTETLYAVCLSFLNTNPKVDPLSLAWGFPLTPENYQRYIKPWRKTTSLAFATRGLHESEEKKQRLNKVTSEVETFRLYTCDLNLYPTSFQVLKSEFLRWAIPLTMQLFEKLSRLVQPDLYKEMLGILKGEVAR